MDRKAHLAVAVVLVVLAFAAGAQAQTAIKLATIVPEGSVWDKNVKQMGEEWKTATDGRVGVTVFAGGTQGDEPTVLRKMRLDALQAGALSAVGLGMIDCVDLAVLVRAWLVIRFRLVRVFSLARAAPGGSYVGRLRHHKTIRSEQLST